MCCEPEGLTSPPPPQPPNTHTHTSPVGLITPSVCVFWGKQYVVWHLWMHEGAVEAQGYSDTCRLLTKPPRSGGRNMMSLQAMWTYGG